MVDEYQIVFEYAAESTISFKTADLNITYNQPYFSIDVHPDGEMVVYDPGIVQRIFKFTSVLTAANMNTLNDQVISGWTYTGLYPRITVLYWDGSTTETNIEVAIPDGGLKTSDMGHGYWRVSLTLVEKTQ